MIEGERVLVVLNPFPIRGEKLFRLGSLQQDSQISPLKCVRISMGLIWLLYSKCVKNILRRLHQDIGFGARRLSRVSALSLERSRSLKNRPARQAGLFVG
jgi:hypothetical protein